MQYALVNDKKIEAIKGLNGICIGCGKVVVAKCGNIKLHHWAHKSVRDCDNWWEPETEWHREWKNKFPAEYREICFTDNLTGEVHRADVHISNKVTLEFQNSPISTEELKSRENFYSKLVWIVNAKNFSINFTRNIPNPEDPILNDFVMCGQVYFKKDEIARNTIDEDRIFNTNNPELKGLKTSILHRAFEWKNKHKVWLNTSVPTFLDMGEEVLYWLKERKQERCRFWYVQLVSKASFISKYSEEF